MTEQTAPVAAAEEKKPANGKPRKEPVPLEKFREVVESSSTLTEAANELGLSTASIAGRCKTNDIPTPAQRMGSKRAKVNQKQKKAAAEKPEEKTEPVKVELAPPPKKQKAPAVSVLGPLAALEAESVALGVIARALQDLPEDSRNRVIARLQSLPY